MTIQIAEPMSGGALVWVELELVDAGQNDRKLFDQGALETLAASIERDGLAQPPTLRRVGDRYEIVAGERRVRAMRLLGWTHTEAFVRDYDDDAASAVMLVENMVRVNLDPVEEARAFKARLDNGMGLVELARLVGLSQGTIQRRILLLELGDDARKLISSGNLALSYAELMVGLDGDRQNLALRALSAGDLSLAGFRAVCAKLRGEQAAEPMFSPEAFWSVEEYVVLGDRAAKLSRMEGQMMTMAQVAETVGLTVTSVRTFRKRGVFPQPDGYFGREPWWKAETVSAWQETRRKPGRPRQLALGEDE